MSLPVIFLPRAARRRLDLVIDRPCLRRMALTSPMFSARISPLKILPLRSLPSHSKTYCVAAFLAAVLRAGAAAVALFWAGRAAGARVAMVGSYPPVWERLIEKVIGSL
jgi:hypothetical protein